MNKKVYFNLTPNTPVSVWRDMADAMEHAGIYDRSISYYVSRTFNACLNGYNVTVIVGQYVTVTTSGL